MSDKILEKLNDLKKLVLNETVFKLTKDGWVSDAIYYYNVNNISDIFENEIDIQTKEKFNLDNNKDFFNKIDKKEYNLLIATQNGIVKHYIGMIENTFVKDVNSITDVSMVKDMIKKYNIISSKNISLIDLK